jgi:hypothetical protein
MDDGESSPPRRHLQIDSYNHNIFTLTTIGWRGHQPFTKCH